MTIGKKDQARLADLAAIAESDSPLPAGKRAHGHREDDPDYGQRLLLEALGTPEAVEEAIRRGRPPVGSTTPAGAQSPVIRARIDPAREARLEAITQSTGKKPSTLLREAIDLLLVSYETDQPRAIPIDPGMLEQLSRQLHSVTRAVDEQLSGARR